MIMTINQHTLINMTCWPMDHAMVRGTPGRCRQLPRRMRHRHSLGWSVSFASMNHPPWMAGWCWLDVDTQWWMNIGDVDVDANLGWLVGHQHSHHSFVWLGLKHMLIRWRFKSLLSERRCLSALRDLRKPRRDPDAELTTSRRCQGGHARIQ